MGYFTNELVWKPFVASYFSLASYVIAGPTFRPRSITCIRGYLRCKGRTERILGSLWGRGSGVLAYTTKSDTQ